MVLNQPSSTWPPHLPPEVPPQPPHRPFPPGQPPAHPAPERPILPAWEEPFAPGDQNLADRLLEQRIVHLGGSLDTALATRGSAQLLLLGRRSDSAIELHVTLGDSELDAALALAGTIDIVTAPVRVIVHGMLVGPAVAVLCAGQERGAHRGATIVVSVPAASGRGTADELSVQAEQHERQLARLRAYLARATGRDERDLDADLRTGRVLSAEDALEFGLLDRLL